MAARVTECGQRGSGQVTKKGVNIILLEFLKKKNMYLCLKGTL